MQIVFFAIQKYTSKESENWIIRKITRYMVHWLFNLCWYFGNIASKIQSTQNAQWQHFVCFIALPWLVGQVVRHHTAASLKQGTTDDTAFTLGPLFPFWVQFTSISHSLRWDTEVRVHLPAVREGRDLNGGGTTLWGGEVVSLVTIKVSTQSLNLDRKTNNNS
jgi:hypothetical protein